MTRFDRQAGTFHHSNAVALTLIPCVSTTRDEQVASVTDRSMALPRARRVASVTDRSTSANAMALPRPRRVASVTDRSTSTNAMARPEGARTRKSGGVRGPFRGPRT